jgi:hypothetical protein
MEELAQGMNPLINKSSPRFKINIKRTIQSYNFHSNGLEEKQITNKNNLCLKESKKRVFEELGVLNG